MLAALGAALSIVMQDQLVLRVGGLGVPLHRVVFAAGLVFVMTHRRRSQARTFLRIAVIWLALCSVILVVHPTRQQSVATFLNYGVDGLLVALLLRTSVGLRFLRRVMRMVFWITVAMAGVAILEFLRNRYVMPDGWVAFRTRERFGRIRGQGLFPHPLVLGVACAVFFIAAREVLTSSRVARWSRFVLLGGLLATQSRGPLLMLVGAAAIFYASVVSRRVRWLWPLLAITLVLAALASGDTTGVSDQTSETEVSSAYRTLVIEVGTDVVTHHPTGLGFGSLEPGPGLSELIRGFGGRRVNVGHTVDNDFALIGIYGGALLELAYIGMLVWAALALVRRGLDRDVRTAAAVLGAVAIGSCFVATFSWPVLSFLTWVAIAGALSSHDLVESVQHRRRRRRYGGAVRHGLRTPAADAVSL